MSKAGTLEAVGSLIRSQRPGGLQCPNPPAFSDLPKEGVLLPASVDDNYRQIDFSVALAGEEVSQYTPQSISSKPQTAT